MITVQDAYDRGWEAGSAPQRLSEEYVNHKDHNPYDVASQRDLWEAFARGFGAALHGPGLLTG